MTVRTADLPDIVRRKVEAQGPVGIRWLEELDDLVRDLERDWDLTTESVLTGGSEALVMSAVRRDREQVVLKVGIPETGAPGHGSLRDEARILRLAGGRGYVPLLGDDAERNAILVLRLGRRVADLDLPVRSQIEIICRTLRRAWVPIEGSHGLMTGANKARSLAAFIETQWDSLGDSLAVSLREPPGQAPGHPCAETTRDRALAFAAARAKAHDPASSVLVHGDGHPFNTLEDPRETDAFAFIDPDGFVGDPAYDLGILMRDWTDEVLAGDARIVGERRCRLLSTLTGLDEAAIWQWGFIEQVSTGLFLLKLGQHAAARDFLAVAEAWTAV